MITIYKQLASRDRVAYKFSQLTADHHSIETSYYNLDEHIICIS